jgi:cell cycle sensor histidine kinase DivJ
MACYSPQSAEKLFGCHRYELSGAGLIERVVLDRRIRRRSRRPITTAHRGSEMRRDDPAERPGAAVPGSVALTPVIDAETDSPQRVVALLRDVTEQHQQDIEMREARRRRDASNANRASRRSARLRTPLNAIVGFSEMMTSGVVGELSPQHQEYATLIQQSGHHLIDVVKMLLDMSRLDAGKFELTTEPIAPESLVEPCLKMVDGMARDKSVRLMTDIPRSLPMLIADERACRQILINLLSNAINSATKGVVRFVKQRGACSTFRWPIAASAWIDAVSRIGEPFDPGRPARR